MIMRIVLIIILILWNKLLPNLTEVWNVNVFQEKMEQFKKIPHNKKLISVRRDIHLHWKQAPVQKFSNKLHI